MERANSTNSIMSRDGLTYQGRPEIWIAFSAASLRLLTISRVDIFSFAPGRDWDSVEIQQTNETIEELQSQIAIFEKLMNKVTPGFFSGKDINYHERAELTKLLRETTSQPILEQTRCLAPDFFKWLETGPPKDQKFMLQ